jgi:serine/threonine protein kinase
MQASVSAQDFSVNPPVRNAPDDNSGNCLPVGTRLADFEITGIVGEGGFGIVYMAFDHALQRTIAIKEYMPGSLAGRGNDQSAVVIRSPNNQETFQAGLKSFINEARLLARFDHPALIKVYHFWEQNKTAYMAMRYYEGQTLKGIIKNHPEMVTEAWLKAMLGPVLEALESLYQLQVLHRDISPDNIMIQQRGGAVLLDFGAARQIIGDLTQALTVILKPGYAPVEQYSDDASMKQGQWTDIYALSAVLYCAITKKPPPASIARVLKDPVRQLQCSDYPAYSPAFLNTINQGLSVRSEERPQTIGEFRQLLGIDPFTVDNTGIGTVPPAVPATQPRIVDLQPAHTAATDISADVTVATVPVLANARTQQTFTQTVPQQPPVAAPQAAATMRTDSVTAVTDKPVMLQKVHNASGAQPASIAPVWIIGAACAGLVFSSMTLYKFYKSLLFLAH